MSDGSRPRRRQQQRRNSSSKRRYGGPKRSQQMERFAADVASMNADAQSRFDRTPLPMAFPKDMAPPRTFHLSWTPQPVPLKAEERVASLVVKRGDFGWLSDERVDAIAPQITWHSLTTSLFPSQTGDPAADTVAAVPQTEAAGVYKQLWSGLFFGIGSAAGGLLDSLDGAGGAPGAGGGAALPAGLPERLLEQAAADPEAAELLLTCGRFRLEVCEAYQAAASTGTLTPEIAAVLDASCAKHRQSHLDGDRNIWMLKPRQPPQTSCALGAERKAERLSAGRQARPQTLQGSVRAGRSTASHSATRT